MPASLLPALHFVENQMKLKPPTRTMCSTEDRLQSVFAETELHHNATVLCVKSSRDW